MCLLCFSSGEPDLSLNSGMCHLCFGCMLLLQQWWTWSSLGKLAVLRHTACQVHTLYHVCDSYCFTSGTRKWCLQGPQAWKHQLSDIFTAIILYIYCIKLPCSSPAASAISKSWWREATHTRAVQVSCSQVYLCFFTICLLQEKNCMASSWK